MAYYRNLIKHSSSDITGQACLDTQVLASKHTTLTPFLQDSHLQPGCPVLQWSGHLTTTDSTLYKTPPCTPFTGLTHTLSSLNVKPTQSPQTPLHCLGQTPHCTPHLISPNTSHCVPNIIMYTLHTLYHTGRAL